MFKPSRRDYVCLRCLSRRFYSAPSNTSSQTNISPLPPPPPPSGAAKLTNKRLLSIHGHDAAHFLQGLTTNTVRPSLTTDLYSAFLTATGRVLHDVFIYPVAHTPVYTSTLPASLSPADPAYLIEVDASEAHHLLAHIKRYKLRSRFAARLLDPGEWDVWSVWHEEDKWTPHPSPMVQPGTTHTEPPPPAAAAADAGADADVALPGCIDARAPGMGRRILLPSPSSSSSTPLSPMQELHEAPLTAYTLRRLLRGVPEGPAEIPRDAALPAEYNLDFMGAIDFRKGCYVGQELTIRTHHTGVVRKRVLPVVLYSLLNHSNEEGGGNEVGGVPERLEYDPTAQGIMQPLRGSNIARVGKKSGRSAGKWVGGVGNVGLALCRLEMMTDLVLTGEGRQGSGEDEFKIVWEEGEGGEGGAGVGEEGGEGRGGGRREGGRMEVGVKAFVPDWMRNRLKVKNPNRRVE